MPKLCWFAFLLLLLIPITSVSPVFAQEPMAPNAEIEASPAYIQRMKKVFAEAKILGALFEDGKFNASHRERLQAFETELTDLVEDPQLLALTLEDGTEVKDGSGVGLHYTEREGLTKAHRSLFPEQQVIQFDSKVLLLDAIGTTFETDWYGYSNTFVYLLNEKYRNYENYRKAAQLLGVHAGGCSRDFGPENAIAGICIARIAQHGFSDMGQFEIALEWAREAADYLQLLETKDVQTRVIVLLDLAELELRRGTNSAARDALNRIPEFSDADIVAPKYGADSFSNAGKLRQKISDIRSQLNEGTVDERIQVRNAIAEFIDPNAQLNQIEIIEYGSLALAAMRADELSGETEAAVRRKLDELKRQNGIGQRVGRLTLSPGKQDDLAVLAGHHTGIIANKPLVTFATILYQRDYQRKARLSNTIYTRIYNEYYSNWGTEVDFFGDMAKIVDALDRLEYPLAAHMVRRNMVGMLHKYSSDDAARRKLQVDLSDAFLPAHASLAEFYIRAKMFGQARRSIRSMSMIARAELERNWKGGRQDLGRTIATLSPFVQKAVVLQNRLEKASGKTADFDLAFQNMQLSQLGEVALSMQAGARRATLGDPRTAEAVTELERNADRAAHLAVMRENLSYFMQDGIDQALEKARKQEAQSTQDLVELLPLIESFSSVAPVTSDDVQESLGAREALAAIIGSGETTSVFLITKSDRKRLVLDLSDRDMHQRVALLRKGLDPDDIDLLNRSSFDSQLANQLYHDLFAPFDPILEGVDEIIVVSQGAVSSLPFHVLIARAPGENEAFSEMAWLAKRFAFTTAPSVATLHAQRSRASLAVSTGSKPLLGVGDPEFGTPADSEAVQLASADIARAFRGANANIEVLSTLIPLPETRDELRDVAASLNAETRDLLFADDATETALKTMNEASELANFRVVYFATHGLVAGELDGENEPGLVLTLPDEPSELDDGLLTASEISRFKLNAEFVVLSACNTAAPSGQGGEAFTGLAKAFFSAGAKSVLASHWPVVSTAAVELTTRTFDKLAANPETSRAAALQAAMIDLIERGGAEAHPAYWAPFVIIGQ